MDKLKILFDTDIGTDVDDALALTFLLNEPRCVRDYYVHW